MWLFFWGEGRVCDFIAVSDLSGYSCNLYLSYSSKMLLLFGRTPLVGLGWVNLRCDQSSDGTIDQKPIIHWHGTWWRPVGRCCSRNPGLRKVQIERGYIRYVCCSCCFLIKFYCAVNQQFQAHLYKWLVKDFWVLQFRCFDRARWWRVISQPVTDRFQCFDVDIIQWFKSRWRNPPKVVYMDPHLKDI